MSDSQEFFEQLRRGQQPPSGSLHAQLHRIPGETESAAVQVRRLLRHAEDGLGEIVATIGNILRWHDRDEILSTLSPAERELWLQIKSIAPEPKPEE